MNNRVAELEPMRTIRQLDVALDSILTAMKLTLALLITYVLREIMPSAEMTTETFLDRVLTVRGRRELTKQHDPRVNTALAEACEQCRRWPVHLP